MVVPPREGPLECSSADVRTVLERARAVYHLDNGDGKGGRIRASARFHRNSELTADSTSCWST
jgi:hypothetical protein